MSLYFNGKKYVEYKYGLESEFEEKVFEQSKHLFGSNTILLDVKKKLNSGELGKTIPDGFLFDFSDPEDPRFYIIEVELQSHDFYRHIFPQITKFFSFIRSTTADQAKLIDSLYRVIDSSDDYKEIFKKFLKGKELFKFLKDVIEDSSDILLIIDGKKSEIDEIKVTYSETWGKYVKQIICKTFRNESEVILFTEPDFEVVEAGSEDLEDETGEDQVKPVYSIDYHLSDSSDLVKKIFATVKNEFSDITFNPQRYYIGMNKPAFAVLVPRKKLIRLVVFLPLNEVKKIVKNYAIKEPSLGEQKFWNAKCTHVRIDHDRNLDEVIAVLKIAQKTEIIKAR